MYNYDFTTLFKHNIPYRYATTRLTELILINRERDCL